MSDSTGADRCCYTPARGPMAWDRWLAPVIVLLSIMSLPGRLLAVEEIVELQLQRAKSLSGVVVYPNGDPVEGAKVEELSPNWKETLRSTETDSMGRFTLTPVKGRKIYYLQISARGPGVNPLRVPVAISRLRGTKLLRLQLHLA